MGTTVDKTGLESLRQLISFQSMIKGDSIYIQAERAMRDTRNKFLPNEREKKAKAGEQEKRTEFPVNIRKIIQKAGIQLYEINMNENMGFQLEKVKGHIRRQENEKWAIYVENDESEYDKRYIMAHEFCHLLIQEMRESEEQLDGNKSMQYCINPLFSKDKYELFADMMAAFLMFPYESVLECMEDYVEELKKKNTYPMDAFEWMCVLGRHAQISSYYTIISYQYLRHFLREYYSGIADDKFKQKYERFFR